VVSGAGGGTTVSGGQIVVVVKEMVEVRVTGIVTVDDFEIVVVYVTGQVVVVITIVEVTKVSVGLGGEVGTPVGHGHGFP
jgi:hypothetical protein